MKRCSHRIQLILLALNLLSLCAVSAGRDNSYFDDVTGFSVTIPAQYEFQRRNFPPAFTTIEQNGVRDYILIDKLYQDMTAEAAAVKWKERLEKDKEDPVKVELRDVPLKEGVAVVLSFSKKERVKGGKKDAQACIALVRSFNVVTSVYFIFFNAKSDGITKTVDETLATVSFKPPTRSVPLFFSPKLSEVYDLVKDGKFREALDTVESEKKKYPGDPYLLFYEGEVLARLKEDEKAVTAVKDSAEAGFFGWGELMGLEGLSKLGTEGKFNGLYSDRKALMKKGRGALLAMLKKKIPHYYEIRIFDGNGILLTDIKDNGVIGILKESVGTAAGFAGSELGMKQPDFPIIWIMSDNREVNKALIGNMLGGSSSAFAGVYMPVYGIFFADKKTGYGTFVHEYIHALHSFDEGGKHQSHPRWLAEMLATVFEELRFDAGPEKMVVEPYSFRTEVYTDALKKGKLISVEKLLSLKDDDMFKDNDISVFYAVVRQLGIYLRHEGKLKEFYDAYTASFSADSTGKTALEKVCGCTLAELQPKLDTFTRELKRTEE